MFPTKSIKLLSKGTQGLVAASRDSRPQHKYYNIFGLFPIKKKKLLVGLVETTTTPTNWQKPRYRMAGSRHSQFQGLQDLDGQRRLGGPSLSSSQTCLPGSRKRGIEPCTESTVGWFMPRFGRVSSMSTAKRNWSTATRPFLRFLGDP